MVLKIGIVGCGRIASTFEEDDWREHPCTHAGAYSVIKNTKIVAASDIDENRLKNFNKKWKPERSYCDYRDMLEKEDLDILSVTSNTITHKDVVIDAAKSGIRAIFCEKPIATNLKDADEMISVCEKNNVKLTINHTLRWNPYYQRAKKLSKEIGEITCIAGYFVSGLLIKATHIFDLFRYFGGDVEWVVAGLERGGGCEDTDPSGFGLLKFKNNIVGGLFGSCRKEYLTFEIDIQGTNGRIRIVDNKNIELYLPDSNRKHVDYNTSRELVRMDVSPVPETNTMVSAVKDVINSIEGDRDTLCTGKDGRDALELALSFHKSAKEGNRKVNLPLEDRNMEVVCR